MVTLKNKPRRSILLAVRKISIFVVTAVALNFILVGMAQAAPTPANCPSTVTTAAQSAATDCPLNFGNSSKEKDICGDNTDNKGVKISIDIGCQAKGNPIVDALFAISRFLSIGVGVIAVTMMVIAGIQYTSAQGNPTATANALKRIRNIAIALAFYMFIYAILNWLVPGGLFS